MKLALNVIALLSVGTLVGFLIYRFVAIQITEQDFKNIAFGCHPAQVSAVQIYQGRLEVWCRDGRVLEFVK